MVSQGSTPNDTVICWTEPRLKEGISKKDKLEYVRVKTEGMLWGSSELRALDIYYVRMSEPSKIYKIPVPEGYEEKSLFPIAITPNYIVWDSYRHGWRRYSDTGWVDGTVTKWCLWVYDIRRNVNIQLDNGGCDSVFVDGGTIAWEKYQEKENDQFYNVKYAQLENKEE